MDARSSATGQTLGSIKWPAGSKPVSVLRHRSLQDPGPGLKLTAGDRVSLLIPASSPASTDLPDQTASPR